jgi:hypothetical protein
MAAALWLLVLAQAAPPFSDLAHESRAVRDEAIRRLAEGGPASAGIAALLAEPDPRIALGAAEILRRRRDPSVLPLLARAADGPDGERADAAATALVATAAEARVAMSALAFEGMRLLPERLDRAWRAAVRERILPLDHRPSTDRPQLYRALFAGEEHAARALLEIASDTTAKGAARAHALHAYARLTGSVPAETLVDPEEMLRGAAASLLLRYGDEEDLARLAGLLDSGRALQPLEFHCAVHAVRRVGRAGPAGRAALAHAIRERPPSLAADAAAALVEAAPTEATHPLRTRVTRHLARAEAGRAGGAEAALFELRAGPLPEDLRARLRAAGNPLLAACVAEDPLAAARPLLARRLGGGEAYRLEIVARLLERGDAPAGDRVTFAASALGSESTASRRAGLQALRPAPPEAWAALRPRVEEALGDVHESVRLAAAELLAPAPEALRVCADALYDGDPWAARRVALTLRRVESPAIDPLADVAARRQQARELGGH